VLTSFGVFQGMRACAERLWDSPTLRGRRVGISGVGKVGSKLAALLLDDGAEVVVTDVSEQAVARLMSEHPEVEVVDDTTALATAGIDVYAPCALGGALDDDMVAALVAGGTCTAVCGGANNQLAHPGVEKMLEDRSILYAPDYVVNSGGVIQVADELHGFSFERAQGRARQIFETTRRIFALAADEGVPPAVAADRLAERRMAEVARLRGIHLPT
jgi:valine dehydrogenase (NAD+)